MKNADRNFIFTYSLQEPGMWDYVGMQICSLNSIFTVFEPAVMQLLLFSVQYAGHYKIAGSEPPHLTCHHLFMSKKVAKDISSKPKEDKYMTAIIPLWRG